MQAPEQPRSKATTLLEVLREVRQRAPRAPLYTFADRRGEILEQLDGPTLVRQAASVAQQLIARGHVAGDRVLLAYSPDAAGFVGGLWGALLAGCVPVPVAVPDPREPDGALRTFRHIVEDCGARTALTDRKIQALMTLVKGKDRLKGLFGKDGAERMPALAWVAPAGLATEAEADALLEAALRRVGPDDLAFLQYTSGSTSEPRGVMVRHRNVVHNTRLIARNTNVEPSSVLVCWVPMYHDMGLTAGVFNAAVNGAHLVFLSPFSFLANPEVWLDLAERFGGTHLAAPDFGYRYLVKHATPGKQWRLPALQTLYQGGEPMRADTVRQMVERFSASGLSADKFCNVFGMAETVLFVMATPGLGAAPLRVDRIALERAGEVKLIAGEAAGLELITCGIPDASMGVEVLAVEPETRVELGADRIGELWVRSPSVCDGYFGHPREATSERFQARLAGDDPRTFLRTGDLGFIHERKVFICGRRKDMIILAGRNIYPQDLETSLQDAHSAIRRGCVAVVGLPGDPDERIGVLAELKSSPADPGEVVRSIQSCLAANHRLGAHAVVLLKKNALPKTSSGKIRRGKCRTDWLSGELRPATIFEIGVPSRSSSDEGAEPTWWAQLGRTLRGAPRATAPAAPAAPAPEQTPEERLCQQLRALAAAQMGLEPEAIDVDRPLLEQGFDSLHLMAFSDAAAGLFDLELTPALGMRLPTLRALAQHFSTPAAPAESAHRMLAPLRAEGTEPPLVLLPPVGGHALWCLALARELRSSLPVWAFQSPEMTGGPSPDAIDELTKASVAELVKTLPDAPSYRVGGYSLGSTLALETARQLVEAGRRVECVLLIGGTLSRGDRTPQDSRELLGELALQLGIPADQQEQLRALGFEGVIKLFARQTRALAPDAPEDLEPRMLAAAQHNLQRSVHWTPRPVDVPVVLLRSALHESASDGGWRALARGDFEVVDVDGDHASMVRAPHAASLARHIERVLDTWGRRPA